MDAQVFLHGQGRDLVFNPETVSLGEEANTK
jgi:hypothetical protein